MTGKRRVFLPGSNLYFSKKAGLNEALSPQAGAGSGAFSLPYSHRLCAWLRPGCCRCRAAELSNVGATKGRGQGEDGKGRLS